MNYQHTVMRGSDDIKPVVLSRLKIKSSQHEAHCHIVFEENSFSNSKEMKEENENLRKSTEDQIPDFKTGEFEDLLLLLSSGHIRSVALAGGASLLNETQFKALCDSAKAHIRSFYMYKVTTETIEDTYALAELEGVQFNLYCDLIRTGHLDTFHLEQNIYLLSVPRIEQLAAAIEFSQIRYLSLARVKINLCDNLQLKLLFDLIPKMHTLNLFNTPIELLNHTQFENLCTSIADTTVYEVIFPNLASLNETQFKLICRLLIIKQNILDLSLGNLSKQQFEWLLEALLRTNTHTFKSNRNELSLLEGNQFEQICDALRRNPRIQTWCLTDHQLRYLNENQLNQLCTLIQEGGISNLDLTEIGQTEEFNPLASYPQPLSPDQFERFCEALRVGRCLVILNSDTNSFTQEQIDTLETINTQIKQERRAWIETSALLMMRAANQGPCFTYTNSIFDLTQSCLMPLLGISPKKNDNQNKVQNLLDPDLSFRVDSLCDLKNASEKHASEKKAADDSTRSMPGFASSSSSSSPLTFSFSSQSSSSSLPQVTSSEAHGLDERDAIRLVYEASTNDLNRNSEVFNSPETNTSDASLQSPERKHKERKFS